MPFELIYVSELNRFLASAPVNDINGLQGDPGKHECTTGQRYVKELRDSSLSRSWSQFLERTPHPSD